MFKGWRVSSDSFGRGSKTGQDLSYYQTCDDKGLGSGLVGGFASEAEGGYLFTYKRENPGEGDNYFVDVYRFVMDVEDKDLKLQTEETDGYMFATLEQIRAFAAEGKFLHYDSIKKVFEF